MSRRNFLSYVKKVTVVIFLVLFVFLIRSLIVSIFSTRDRAQIIKNLQAELSYKQKEQAYLSQKLYFAKTDAFVQEEARQKLGLVLPGEQIVVDRKIEPEKPKVEPIAVPIWQKWQRLFF